MFREIDGGLGKQCATTGTLEEDTGDGLQDMDFAFLTRPRIEHPINGDAERSSNLPALDDGGESDNEMQARDHSQEFSTA
mmetsp:Transcript_26453/g.61960  ORF Transcript_26453/g.61960 Transcript_26453/m.61960 type:complete len:80 (+) Transcript_26453:54-293(+)